jgi:sugar phosphate isomerase/epimerase
MAGPRKGPKLKLSCLDAIAPGETLEDKFKNLEKFGFQGIEIWLGSENLQQSEKEMREAASGSSVKPSLIIVVNEVFYRPLDSPEAKQAKSEVIKESLRIAAATGAISLVIPEYGPQLCPPIFLPPAPGEPERKLLLELLEEVGRYAQDVGATLVLEPINRYETRFFHTLDEAVGICKEVGSPNIKVMADLFQMSIEERNIAESIRRAGKYIHYVHLSDNNRLLPGYGHIDFRSAFRALKEIGYEGYMGLECAIAGDPEKDLPECVKYLKKCMREC